MSIINSFSCRLLCAFSLMMVTWSLCAERYQVSTDNDGNAKVDQIESLDSVPSPQEPANNLTSKSEGFEAGKNVQSSKKFHVKGIADTASSESVEKAEDAGPVENLRLNRDEASSEISRDKKAPSVFEQRMLESEGKTREELLSDLSNRGQDSQKIIMLNGVRYVDGEALLQDESLADDRARYFTTIDLDGRAHNVYFSPEMEKIARKELREKKIQYTSATEYVQHDEMNVASAVGSGHLGNADPAALAILGADSPLSYFSVFLGHCCQRLPNRMAHDLESGVPLFFDIKSEDSPYRFSEGDSRYVLIRLPEDANDFSLRLKSFIKEFRKHDIDYGVFYPQVTLLNKEKKPLRMIRDASFEFSGETWSSYGFLQGVFRVNRQKEGAEEYFMLIHTDRSALNNSSYFEMDQEQIQVQHMSIGSVSLEIIAEK